jgi:hypothetical protein
MARSRISPSTLCVFSFMPASFSDAIHPKPLYILHILKQ